MDMIRFGLYVHTHIFDTHNRVATPDQFSYIIKSFMSFRGDNKNLSIGVLECSLHFYQSQYRFSSLGLNRVFSVSHVHLYNNGLSDYIYVLFNQECFFNLIFTFRQSRRAEIINK